MSPGQSNYRPEALVNTRNVVTSTEMQTSRRQYEYCIVHCVRTVPGDLARWRLEEVYRVTIGHLRVTIGRLRVTVGHLRDIVSHPWVTIGYL